MFVVALLNVNFHNNRIMSSTNLHVKNCRWGGGKEKEPLNCITGPSWERRGGESE